MKIQSIQKTQPTFGMKLLTERKISNPNGITVYYKDIKLNDNRQLTVRVEKKDGKILDKLLYLTDKSGKWLQSTLKIGKQVYRSKAK